MGERLTKAKRAPLRIDVEANAPDAWRPELIALLDECDALDRERAAEARKRMLAEARTGIHKGAKEVAEGATIATLLALSVAKAEAEYVRDQHDRDWLFTWEGGGVRADIDESNDEPPPTPLEGTESEQR